ncbi:hypothetical protein HYU93_03805 [Candidatus Daviesbacteria bacterium]|nr:hypothetical protein [Candidatus Daviesbacteria bacterium]
MQDTKNAVAHLREHQKYPASKADLVKECNNLSDFSGADKRWFMENLPEGAYNSADEVIGALGLEPLQGQSMPI